MNNAKLSKDYPNLDFDTTFDYCLKIFTAVFFIALYCWLNFNPTDVQNTNQLSKTDLKPTSQEIQPVLYSNAIMGFNLDKIQRTFSKSWNADISKTEIKPLPNLLNLTTTEVKSNATIPTVEKLLNDETDHLPTTSTPYILNKSLANNEAVGPSNLFKDLEIPEKVEKEAGIELVDGSELLIISLNEMHLLKLPANTEMKFVESDGNEFAAKASVSEEEKKATLDAVKEVVKGDELAFISEKELDEIKIVETVVKKEETNNSTTKEFAVKGIEDRSEVLYNALELASAENKVVMISFGAKWCLPCREMYKNVFPDPTVKSLLKNNYVYLKMDSNDLEAISMKQIYNVEAYPTTLFVAPNGEEMDRYEEGISLAKMITILNQNKLENRPEFGVGVDVVE